MASKTDHKIVLSAQDKTKSALRSVQTSLGGLKNSVFGLQTALGLLAGGAGFGALASNALRSVDSLAKVSRKLGTTTEALAGFRYAAELSGVSTNTMDMALQRFTRRASEAALGTGEAKDALKELGLDATKLVKLPLDQQMFAVADAFEGVEKQSDKVRLAMKLFDSEGVALVNTLEGGSAALQRTASEARGLGLAIDQTRASGIERFNDSMTRLRSAIDGAFIQAMGDVAPQLDQMATKLQDVLVPAIKGLINVFNWFLNNLDTITAMMKGFFAAMLYTKLINMVYGTADLVRNLIVLGKVSKISGRALLRGLGGPLIGVAITVAEMTGTLDKLLEQFGLMGDTTLPGLDEAFSSANTAALGLNARLQVTKGAGDEATDTLTNVKKASSSLADVMKGKLENGMNAVTDGLTDLIMGTARASDAFRNMATSIIRDIIRMNIQQSITTPLSGLLGNVLSAGIGSIGTAMQYGTNIGSEQTAMLHAQSFAGGGFTGVGPRSGGLDGKGGFPAMLHPNETVVDHTEGQGGGVTIVQNINVSTGVQQTVRTEIATLMPQIANAAKSAVLDARKRGGSFAGAFS